MQEYGLFSDEGLVEGGFYSSEEADAAIEDRYSLEDELDVAPICASHRDYRKSHCEKCDSE